MPVAMLCHGESGEASLRLQPTLLEVGQDSLQSGFDLALDSDLLDLSFDSSVTLDENAYRYRVVPGFSKSIDDLADLSVRYEYELNQPFDQALAKEKMGYSMGLKGSLQEGRLTWKSRFRSTSIYEQGLAHTQDIELLEFESRYQLVSALHLELSSAVRDETSFSGGLIDDIYSERRYGAGISWAPSRYYSLAFKLNRLDESRYDSEQLTGSGKVSWFPQRNLEFSLSYGDQLVEGARGVLFSTRINLDES